MSEILATQFASSPAGYITGIAAPAALVMIGWLGKRFTSRLDRQDGAMAQHTTALAVLISEHTTTADRAMRALTQGSTLSEAMAVLKSRLDAHEEWSKAEYERAISAVVGGRTTPRE